MTLVIILLVVGAVLLLLETILPGLVAGFIGLCCLVAGIVLGYAQFDPRTANLILLAVLLVLVGGFACWVKFFPESRLGRVFVSKRVVGKDVPVIFPSASERLTLTTCWPIAYLGSAPDRLILTAKPVTERKG